jgi:hypothetical protein
MSLKEVSYKLKNARANTRKKAKDAKKTSTKDTSLQTIKCCGEKT